MADFDFRLMVRNPGMLRVSAGEYEMMYVLDTLEYCKMMGYTDGIGITVKQILPRWVTWISIPD